MYIDGVFSGGGIKGLALIGAYAEIENRGLKFQRLAGTSAGSIIAAFIAAGYTSKEILSFMDEFDLEELLDERKTFLPSAITKWILLYFRLGLYKGDKLEQWVGKKLNQKGVNTFGDLPPQTLRVVASDITNGQLIVLPDDLKQYGIDPSTFSVAKAIRMSTSIPYFFEPVKLKTRSKVNVIVDGGVLSNFPLWLFDQDQEKKIRPVLGVKLSRNKFYEPKHKIDNAIDLFEALFATMKDAHDARYISRKHEKNIIFIPTNSVMATDFALDEEKKLQLVEHGRQCAHKFLEKWAR